MLGSLEGTRTLQVQQECPQRSQRIEERQLQARLREETEAGSLAGHGVVRDPQQLGVVVARGGRR